MEQPRVVGKTKKKNNPNYYSSFIGLGAIFLLSHSIFFFFILSCCNLKLLTPSQILGDNELLSIKKLQQIKKKCGGDGGLSSAVFFILSRTIIEIGKKKKQTLKENTHC